MVITLKSTIYNNRTTTSLCSNVNNSNHSKNNNNNPNCKNHINQNHHQSNLKEALSRQQQGAQDHLYDCCICRRTFGMGCCGNKMFRHKRSICCYGVLHPTSPDTMCCRRSAYDRRREVCCSGRVHRRRRLHDFCCGKELCPPY